MEPREQAKQRPFVDTELVSQMLSLYGEERTRFYKAVNGAVFLVKDPTEKKPLFLTRGHVAQHLRGKYAICVIGSPNGSRFTCFDVDHGGWEMVVKVVNELERMGIAKDHIYVSTSGGKGYHVEIFYDRVVDYLRQKCLYNELIFNIQASRRDVELRPTHTQSIKIPLSVHQKTGNTCWFLDRDTGEPILDKNYVLGIQRLNADRLEEEVLNDLLDEQEEEDGKLMTRDNVLVPFEMTDLNYLPSIDSPGSRHDLTMRIAMTLRRAGRTKASARSTLVAWYDRQDKSLTGTDREEAIEDICRITDWVFAKYKFASSGQKSGCKVSRSDIEKVLDQRGINRRAIMFHVVVWEKSAAMADVTTMEAIGHIIGTTKRSVCNTWGKMRNEGMISITVSKPKRDKFGYYQSKSRIRTTLLPASLEIPEDKLLQEMIYVDPVRLNKDFWRVYFETLFTVADRDWVMTKLSKRERDKLAEIEKEGTINGTQD